MDSPTRNTNVLPAATVVTLATSLAIAAVWGGTLWFAMTHWGSLYDDAYIYFRYVENLFAGCGLRYNCSEPPVEGFTSPLYLGLLAASRIFTTDLAGSANLLGTLCVGATGTLAVLTVGRAPLASQTPSVKVAAVLGCALLMASDHLWLLNAAIGLEAPLASLVVMLIVRAALNGQHRLLRTWVLVGALCRPECILFALALPIFREARQVRYFLYPVAALLGLLVLRVLYFDELLPNTYYAKSGGTYRHAVLGLQYIGEICSDFPLTLLAPLALIDARLRRPTAYYLAATLAWYAFFIRSGGDTFYYSRLAVPLIPGLEVLAINGLFVLGDRLSHQVPRWAWSGSLLAPGFGLAGVAWYAVANHTIGPSHGFDNVKRYKAIGEYIGRHHRGATVATVPIGAIGYFSGARIIDLVGLTAPAIAHAGTTVPAHMLDRKWIGHERHDTEWVLEQAPDLIVTTQFRHHPWKGLQDTSAGFIADWLLLRAIKAGAAPYRVLSAEVRPGLHCLMFQRDSKLTIPATAKESWQPLQ